MPAKKGPARASSSSALLYSAEGGEILSVFDAKFSQCYRVPKHLVAHLPPARTSMPTSPVTNSSTQLVLCPMFHSKSFGYCPAGESCPYVHVTSLERVESHSVHARFYWRNESLCHYPRLTGGRTIKVSTRSFVEEIPSERILVTRGVASLNRRATAPPPQYQSQHRPSPLPMDFLTLSDHADAVDSLANASADATSPCFSGTPTEAQSVVFSHCSHYLCKALCLRGWECRFVHSVSVHPDQREPFIEALPISPVSQDSGQSDVAAEGDAHVAEEIANAFNAMRRSQPHDSAASSGTGSCSQPALLYPQSVSSGVFEPVLSIETQSDDADRVHTPHQAPQLCGRASVPNDTSVSTPSQPQHHREQGVESSHHWPMSTQHVSPLVSLSHLPPSIASPVTQSERIAANAMPAVVGRDPFAAFAAQQHNGLQARSLVVPSLLDPQTFVQPLQHVSNRRSPTHDGCGSTLPAQPQRDVTRSPSSPSTSSSPVVFHHFPYPSTSGRPRREMGQPPRKKNH